MQCVKLGLPKHSVFQLDDLLDTHGNSDGGNFGMVLYTLGALARFSVARQIIKSNLGWVEVNDRTERIFTVEEVTEASVELLMHDGDAGTPILNFTSKKLPKVDRRRGSVQIVRSRDLGTKGNTQKTGRGINSSEFQRRQSLIQGNLVVTRANIGNGGNGGNSGNGNGGVKGEERRNSMKGGKRKSNTFFKPKAYQVIAEEPKMDVPGGTVRVVTSRSSSSRNRNGNQNKKTNDRNQTTERNNLNHDDILDKLKRCAMSPMSLPRSPMLGVTTELSNKRRSSSPTSANQNGSIRHNSNDTEQDSTSSSSLSGATTSWHLRTIQKWLSDEVGLPEYITLFQQHGWDDVDSILELLDASEAERMGITKRGHVLRIQRGLSTLRHYKDTLEARSRATKTNSSSTTAATTTSSAVIGTLGTLGTKVNNMTTPAGRTRSLVETLEYMSKGLLSSNLNHTTLSELEALVDATRSTVAPGWHSSNGGSTSGPAVVVDVGAHEIRVEVVTASSNESCTAVVVPSVVGRETTSFRSFACLGAPGTSIITKTRRKMEQMLNAEHNAKNNVENNVEKKVETKVKNEVGNVETASNGRIVAVGCNAEKMAEECWLRSVVDIGTPIAIENNTNKNNEDKSSATSKNNKNNKNNMNNRKMNNTKEKDTNERIHIDDLVPMLSQILSHRLPLRAATSSSNSTTDGYMLQSQLLACHPIVLIDSFPLFDKAQRSAVVHELFETFGAPSIAVVPHATAVLVAHGLSTGLVVDVGETSTRVTPVLNGAPLKKWMRRSDLSGKTLTDRTLLHMVHDGYPFRSFAEPQRSDGHVSGQTHLQRRVAQHVKESLCCVRTGEEGTEERRDKAINESEWPCHLRDFLRRSRQHEFVVWREARAEVAECLFDPHESMSGGGRGVGSVGSGDSDVSSIGGRRTLHGMVYDVLSEMSPKMQSIMSSNIVLAGGTSLLPGLPERVSIQSDAGAM